MWEEILLIAGVALLGRFVAAPIARRIMPERYTVRYLLLATTVIAIFLAAYTAWAQH